MHIASLLQVPMNKRINRVTGAIWRFKSGAVGSLFHSLVLHGATYDTELEVLADGLRMVLRDPYGKPQLLVRHPHEEEYREVMLGAAMVPFLAEGGSWQRCEPQHFIRHA